MATRKTNSKSKRGFFSRIFSWFGRSRRTESNLSEEEKNPPITKDGFDRELSKARIKFNNFHLTKTLSSGEEIQKKDYKIKKTNNTVFKLEGKNYQVVLITGNSLYEKNGMTTGILHIQSADLNRALQREHSDLTSFLDLWNVELDDENSRRNWKKILDWEIFWKEQLLIRLRPDTIALLLVSLGSEFESFFFNTATKKQKEIVHDELFYLNQGKNSPDWNPYTKNKSLIDPDLAKEELNQAIETIQERKEKEKES